ncbi:MAG: hypothetical protein QMC67_00410 [Candidatus Wallbacteria bacterium]
MSKKSESESNQQTNITDQASGESQQMQLKTGSGPDFSRIIAAIALCAILLALAKLLGL